MQNPEITEKICEKLKIMPISPSIEKKLRKFATLPNQKIVLSLGGGGAKGVVGNLGLVYLLQRLDLLDQIEEIWAVSAGAMIGATIATGMSVKDTIDIISGVRLRDFIPISLNMPFPTSKVRELFERVLPIKTFEECPRNFYVLATQFTGESEAVRIFSHGSLVDAVTATVAIPGVFKEVELNGQKLCDGGVVENTPCVSIARHHHAKGDDRHLAILSTCFGKEHYDPTLNSMGKVVNLLATYRYRLQLAQNEYTRAQPNTDQLMLNIDVPISKLEFNHMAPHIVPTFGQILDKLSYICEFDNWNIDY